MMINSMIFIKLLLIVALLLWIVSSKYTSSINKRSHGARLATTTTSLRLAQPISSSSSSSLSSSPNSNSLQSNYNSKLQVHSNHISSSRLHLSSSSSSSSIAAHAPKIIIAGAPASGKGTQCEVIKDKYGLIHLSTGDILRAAVKESTSLGVKAKEYMDSGQLVPDELIIGVVCDRLKQDDCLSKGWLLDGFPRTKSQAEALQSMGITPDCFIFLDVPQEILVERVTGRRTDPVTGKIYHMKFSPPTSKEVEDRLVQRSDDTEEKIVIRFKEFESHIDSIKSFYLDKTYRIDGTLQKDSVAASLLAALKQVDDKRIAVKTTVAATSISSPLPVPAAVSSSNGNVIIKIPESASAFTVTGALSLLLIDKLMSVIFKKMNSQFPSSLASMTSVFLSLLAIEKISPTTSSGISEYFSHSVSLFKLWLPMLFVPPLVILPLKMHLIKDMEARLAALLLIGSIVSLSTTGLLANALSAAFSSNKEVAAASTTSGSSKVIMPALPPVCIPLTGVFVAFLAALSPFPTAVKSIAEVAYGVSATMSAYVLAVRHTPRGVTNLVNPVLICASMTWLFLKAFATLSGAASIATLSAYYGSATASGGGDMLAYLLGPAIVSFGLQLFQHRSILLSNLPRVTLTTLIASIIGLFSSAFATRLLHILPAQTALSTLTRCITSPLALAGAKLLSSDASLAAFSVVVTGVIGASIGEKLLHKLNVKDDVSVGLAMGAGAHGLGTAVLIKSPVKFASSVVSMSLTGLWTVALLSLKPLRDIIIKIAIK